MITIVTLWALIISLFGGYFDQPAKERLVSITKAVWKGARNKNNQLNNSR